MPCLREAVKTQHSQVFPFLTGVISCHFSVQFCRSQLLTAFRKVPCILTPPGLHLCAFLCWYCLPSSPPLGKFQLFLQDPSSTCSGKTGCSLDSLLPWLFSSCYVYRTHCINWGLCRWSLSHRTAQCPLRSSVLPDAGSGLG